MTNCMDCGTDIRRHDPRTLRCFPCKKVRQRAATAARPPKASLTAIVSYLEVHEPDTLRRVQKELERSI